jgi:beta-lactamase regulating signal transducer with metallopeptidase domain
MSTSTDLMTTLTWSLLHFLWQGAAIAALAAAVMQAFREATTRYLIGICALALMCTSFGVTVALLAGTPAVSIETTAGAVALSADVAPAATPGTVTLLLERPAAPWTDFAWVARLWLAGVCLLALRVAGGLLLLEHLRRRSLSALPAEIVERCLALQQRLGISRVVRYCECRLVAVPSVIGFFRPIVLLPLRALTGLSAEQLEVVIAHELGHIKRFDVAVNLLQVVVETLFFFHPAVWWLNRRIRADREDCCDDIAISACGRNVSYARALAIMEDWRGPPELSMAATGGDVASRVARLLAMTREPTGARSASVFTAALVLAAALLAGAASIGIAGQGLTTPDSTPPSRTVAPVAAPVAPESSHAAPAPVAPESSPRADAAPTPAVAPLSQIVGQAERPLIAQAAPANPPRGGTPRAPAAAPRSSSFIDEMKAAGFDVSDVDLLISLKVHQVTADYVRQVREAGLTPDGDEIIAMKIHGVTPEHIAQVRAMGIDADVDDVVAMQIHGVTPDYVARVRAEGLDADFDDVVAMKIHGVTPEYVAQVRAMGIAADVDDVLAMRIHGITPEYVTQVRAEGLGADFDDVMAMKIHGVTPEYIAQVRAMGFELDADDVVALKIHGITPEFINEARSHGFEDLSVDELVRLKNADVF